MPGTAGPNLGLVWGYSPHDNGWGVGSYNPAMETLDGIIFLSVVSAAIATPPGSPTAGDRYVVASSPTGAWSGHTNDLAIYRAAAWHFFTPKLGWTAWNAATNSYFRFDGANWVEDLVTNARLATMPAHRFKGNNTGSTGPALDLTATELTAELNDFVGDSGLGGTKGLVNAPAEGDNYKYLKADGTWSDIPWFLSVISIQNAPPVSPSIGDRYVVGTIGSGAWSGHSKAVARWSDVGGTAQWTFLTPQPGWIAYRADTDSLWGYDGAGDWIILKAAPNIIELSGLANNDLLVSDGTNFINRTPAYATALLPVFDTTHKGLVPSPGASPGTTYLRDDGVFGTPPGTGTSGITQLTGNVTAGPGSGSQPATITGHAVTNAMLAQMLGHRFKGNNTGATADPIDLTTTELTAELDVFTTGLKGLVPSPGTPSGKFLKDDSTFATPAGGGGGLGGLWSGQMSTSLPTQASTGLSSWFAQQTSSTVADSACGITVFEPGQGSSHKISAVMKNSAGSGTAQKYTALITRTTASNVSAGIVFGWSDGTKAHVIYLQGLTQGLYISQYSTATAYNATEAQAGNVPSAVPIWLQLEDDGTNINFNISFDGVNFVTINGGARSGRYLGSTGYTKIIFGCDAYDSAVYASMMSWKQA